MKDKQIKYGVILSYLYVIVNVFGGIFFTPFLIKSLGSSQYGLYEMIVSLASNISILNFGLGASVVKYIATYRGRDDKKKAGRSNGDDNKIIVVGFWCRFFDLLNNLVKI